jgi:hypothetical protein
LDLRISTVLLMGFKVVFSIPQIPSFLLCATQDAIETLTQEHSSGTLADPRDEGKTVVTGLDTWPGFTTRK